MRPRQAYFALPGRSIVAIVASVMLAVSFAALLRPSSARAATVSPEAAAILRAETTGLAVPVPTDTTETSTTVANPDGTLTTSISASVQQVQQDGSWVPVDSTLQRNSDGSYSPAATPTSVSFSNGGSGPVATIESDAGDSLSLSWPTALPAPTVQGSTVTYADVLPGVDLEMTADDQGAVQDLLIVKNAQAAANPALQSIHLGVQTSNGLSVQSDSGDDINVVNADGANVFTADAPIMWDSSGDQGSTSSNSAAPAAHGIAAIHPNANDFNSDQASDNTNDPTTADDPAGPDTGDTVAPVDVSTGGNSVTLHPDQSLLSDDSTQFPVVIDPTFVPVPVNKDESAFAWAQEAFPNNSHYNDTSSGQPAVGYEDFNDGATGHNQAFWQFNIGSIGSYDQINSAMLQLVEVNSNGDYNCSDTHSYRIDDLNVQIGSNTDWNHRPSGSDISSNGDTENVRDAYCADQDASFTVKSSIAGNSHSWVAYRLTATNGDNDAAYSRWSGSNAELDITYDNAPNNPTQPSLTPNPVGDGTSSCTDPNNAGWIGADPTNIKFGAHVSDPDTGSGQSIQGRFHVWDTGAGGADSTDIVGLDDNAGHSGGVAPGGADVSISLPANDFKDGHKYAFDAWAWDGNLYSDDSSDHCYFWVDRTGPQIHAPTVSTQGVIGHNTTFTVTANDVAPGSGLAASGIDHFAYSTDSESDLAGNVQPTSGGSGTSTATAQISVKPTVWGVNYFYVQAVDVAGNKSSVYRYQYYVPDDPTAQVHPGDIDGDGRPDLLRVTSGGYLAMTPTLLGQGETMTSTNVAAKSEAPDGSTWSGTLVAHRSSSNQSQSGARVDDLWALKPSATAALYLYTNNLNNAGGLAGNENMYYTAGNRDSQDAPPLCDSAVTDCTNYPSDWSGVTQMVAPGDVDGDGVPDLIMVNNGALWLFHGATTTGRLTDPRLLSATGWNNWRIMAPGDSTGDGVPDIWAADARTASNGGTGQLRLYPITKSCTDQGCAFGLGSYDSTPNDYYGADDRPLITSVGDVDGDGIPDLFSTTTAGELWENPGSSMSATSFSFGPHAVADDGSNISWSTAASLS